MIIAGITCARSYGPSLPMIKEFICNPLRYLDTITAEDVVEEGGVHVVDWFCHAAINAPHGERERITNKFFGMKDGPSQTSKKLALNVASSQIGEPSRMSR